MDSYTLHDKSSKTCSSKVYMYGPTIITTFLLMLVHVTDLSIPFLKFSLGTQCDCHKHDIRLLHLCCLRYLWRRGFWLPVHTAACCCNICFPDTKGQNQGPQWCQAGHCDYLHNYCLPGGPDLDLVCSGPVPEYNECPVCSLHYGCNHHFPNSYLHTKGDMWEMLHNLSLMCF